jgi:tetratricopeptide (TPR) repeat protein
MVPYPFPPGITVSHAKNAVAVVALILVAAPAVAGDVERTPGEIYRQALQAPAWVYTQKQQGTGWVADADRQLVVTNYHVVGSEESVTVVFPDFRDNKLIAESHYQQAVSDYSIALQLDPKDADAYRERGLVQVRLGDLDKAIAYFTQATKVRPEFADAYRSRSIAYRDKGDIDRAVADLEQAIKFKGK